MVLLSLVRTNTLARCCQSELRRLQAPTCITSLPQNNAFQSRYFSETSTNVNDNNSTEGPVHAQPFVEIRILPGEWDRRYKDPLYRPKFKSKARILCEEDFRNRPRVGFSTEFKNLAEGMMTLDWIDRAQRRRVYARYVELMRAGHQKFGKTSHEYVCRVIAQEFRLTFWRAAGIIQLQHNEEQYCKDPNYESNAESEAIMEDIIKLEIDEAYQVEGLPKPESFVEDPVGADGKWEANHQTLDDVYDSHLLMEDTIQREHDRARLMIDNHIYPEDVDEDTIPVPLSKEARRLLQAKAKMENDRIKESESLIPWPKAKERSTKRQQWKFVLQVVNVRDLKKGPKKRKQCRNSYTNNHPYNTLIEENGKLRGANMEDIKHVSWKPIRDKSCLYDGARKGWLDRTVRGDLSAWGPADEIAKPQSAVAATPSPHVDGVTEVDVDASKEEIEGESVESVDDVDERLDNKPTDDKKE